MMAHARQLPRATSAVSVLLLSMLIGVGCAPALTPVSGPSDAEVGTAELLTSAKLDATTITLPPTERTLGYTHQRADGNRLAAGHADLASAIPIDIALAATPAWIAAVSHPDGVLFAAVGEDGGVEAFMVRGPDYEQVPVTPASLPSGMPPLLVADTSAKGAVVYVAEPPVAEPAHRTHPVLLPDGRTLVLAVDGTLVELDDDVERARFAVNALPDARLVVDEAGYLALYSGASVTRYTHGVLGDRAEASAISIFTTTAPIAEVARIELPAPQVFEGIAPFWVDMDGDGQSELVATISDGDVGARLALFARDGSQLAEGPAIGRGQRWRHQLAAAPFTASGIVEITADLTPHIGGVVEFYMWDADELAITATLPGFKTHVLGSYNLDMALAADLLPNGDEQAELVVPAQNFKSLGVIVRTQESARQELTLPLQGHLATNLAAAADPLRRIYLGAGRADGTLRIWTPALPR